ncbi:deoxyribodipyrimidine photo-lyase [Halovenus rubra]|uniref:Deoxyribodipyrimidine photo-lyase n=2 Tax=Halovenus rubra TaxID=869890 RepID=A0ABD5XBE9_9EURY
MTADIVVWHRDDLRVSDNPALRAAGTDGRVHPLFVFDPHFYRSTKFVMAGWRFSTSHLSNSLRHIKNAAAA